MLLGTARPPKVLTSTVMVFLTPFLLLHQLLWPHRLQKNKEKNAEDPELEDEVYTSGILI